MSFADNGLELKIYLNSEIGRLKEGVKRARESEEIRDDERMLHQTNEVLEVLEAMRERPIEDDMISQVMKIQSLVSETRGETEDVS